MGRCEREQQTASIQTRGIPLPESENICKGMANFVELRPLVLHNLNETTNVSAGDLAWSASESTKPTLTLGRQLELSGTFNF